MIKTIVFLAIAVILQAQTPVPGTVASTTTTAVTATTTTVTCVLSNQNPMLAAGFSVVCRIASNQVLSMTATVAQAANGVVGSFTNAGDTITWQVNQPSGQTTLSWSVVANGTAKSGTF